MQITIPTPRQRIIADCLESPIGQRFLESDWRFTRNIEKRSSDCNEISPDEFTASGWEYVAASKDFDVLVNAVVPDQPHCPIGSHQTVRLCSYCQKPCQ